MTINSPADALSRIITLCSTPRQPVLGFAQPTELRLDILEVARVGLATLALVPIMPEPAATSLEGAIEMLLAQSSVPGRSSLSSIWVHAAAQCARSRMPVPQTPAQRQAEKLLDVALAYEQELARQFRDYADLDADPVKHAPHDPVAAKLVEVRALLEPLRPPKPLDPAIEALLAQARKEQLIGDGEVYDLLDLARRMAK